MTSSIPAAGQPCDSDLAAASLVQGTRPRKTFARLAKAVLELAVEQDISKASVAQLARRAGINRSTFYKFSKSPVDLLASVLRLELDELRGGYRTARKQPGADLIEVHRQGTYEFLNHVNKYASIYGAGHTSTALVIRQVLTEHIIGSFLMMFEEGFEVLPFDEPGSLDIVTAFFGHAQSGAIEAWLALPEPRDVELLHKLLAASYPTWLSFSQSSRYPPARTDALPD